MASTDVDMTPAVPSGEGCSASKKPKRFEIKKWNAVALWAWGSYSIGPVSFSITAQRSYALMETKVGG